MGKDSLDNIDDRSAVPLSSRLDALTPGQKALHNNFISSLKALQRDLVRSAYYLLQIRDRKIYRALGYARIADYALAAGGLNGRQCRDFLAVARRLPRFKEVESALATGDLTWSQARLICTRSDPQEQEQWLETARSLTAQQLAEILPPPKLPVPQEPETPRVDPPVISDSKTAVPRRGPKPSGLPPTLGKPECPGSVPSKTMHHVTLRFTGEQYALWQRWYEAATREGPPVEVLLEHLLGGKAGASPLPIQVVIIECPDCGKAVFPTNRGEIEVPAPLLKAAHCDAVIEDARGNRRHTIPPRIRRLALQRARYRCEAAGCTNTSFLCLHHRRPVSGTGSNDLANLVVLCGRCHRRLHAAEEEAREAVRNAPA